MKPIKRFFYFVCVLIAAIASAFFVVFSELAEKLEDDSMINKQKINDNTYSLWGIMTKIVSYNSILECPKYSSKSIEEKKYRIPSGSTEREAFILKGVLELLKLRGIKHWRLNIQGRIIHTGKHSAVQAPSGQKGMSDIIGLTANGKFIAIEVKRRGGYLTQSQLKFLTDIKNSNGEAIIVSDLERFHTYLFDIFKLQPLSLEGILLI